jgi:hypothetical protein
MFGQLWPNSHIYLFATFGRIYTMREMSCYFIFSLQFKYLMALPSAFLRLKYPQPGTVAAIGMHHG